MTGGAPGRDELRDHLVATGIAGAVATPRQSNLGNIERCVAREPGYDFGLSFARPWSVAEVFAVMVADCGIRPDPEHTEGADTIDPDLTLAALDRVREVLGRAAAERPRVVVATGHPTGLLAVHVRVAAALRDAGCPLLTPAPGWRHEVRRRGRTVSRELRHVAGVAMVGDHGSLHHTHSGRPMRAMLDALAAAGEPPPGLVVGDHGWTGAAGEAGIPAVGFADCNDPALFVGAADGKVDVVVPLDDNVLPHHYDPLSAYLLADLG